MPRPGPRPFECVRRSWHSDRHQPIRGSIIQQIFRIVHENHTPGTKKNREWQEKLPVVVLKSEEILYSKANSEAEYLDSETLWDRLNDAIDTIIRKDETMETGDLLPPCVEAALNLGCVPVRSSRSQRNNNMRSYLSPRNQDSASNSRPVNLPNIQRPVSVDQTLKFSEISNNIPPNFYPFENQPSSIYPLYHGFHFQPRVPDIRFQTPHHNPTSIILGTPVFQTAHDPLPSSSQTGRLFSFDRFENRSQNELQPELAECDLSLRLGLVSSDSSPRTKEFSFFPVNSEAEEDENSITDVRKRKNVGETQHFLHLDPDFERMKRRGL